MKVKFFTEGGEGIGFGHITRCTSVYQGFEERGVEPEMIINGDNSVNEILAGINHSCFNWLEDKGRLADIAAEADMLFIDSYLAGESLYEEITGYVKKTVYFDDNNRLDYLAGVVINGAVIAGGLDYPQTNGKHYLLGTQYIPLRKAYWNVPEKIIKEEIGDVLITFGGDCPVDFTRAVVSFLAAKFPSLHYRVVLRKNEKLNCGVSGDTEISIYSSLDGNQMCRLMLDCDICICGGGQTTYELAVTGTPTISLCFAQNQELNLTGWKEAGFIGDWHRFDDKDNFEKLIKEIEKLASWHIRRERSKIGRGLVDGQGTRRIVNYLLN